MRTANFTVELEYHPTGEYMSFDFDMEFDDLGDDEDDFDTSELEQEAYAAVMESVVVTPTFTGWSE